jgi:hypothetical protein
MTIRSCAFQVMAYAGLDRHDEIMLRVAINCQRKTRQRLGEGVLMVLATHISIRVLRDSASKNSPFAESRRS